MNPRPKYMKDTFDKMTDLDGTVPADIVDISATTRSEADRIRTFVERNHGREVVVVQGIGFVGAGMLAALARARCEDGPHRFAVIGVDLADARNVGKIRSVLAGEPPVVSSDLTLRECYREARKVGNMTATAHPSAFEHASVVVVDVNLDVRKDGGGARNYKLEDGSFRQALKTVADHIREDALVIVETTVPPGTTNKVVKAIIVDGLLRRGLDASRVKIAHSYERVMPGPNYLASITSYYRVFSGIDRESSDRARQFLQTFIDTASYPLTELQSPTASEMAKVLENSFRSANIALIQEWSEFAQAASVDLFEVIEAIRMRSTHCNIMSPGFGVGGYCLTKDSLLADWAARNFYGRQSHLGMSLNSVDVNDAMPRYTLELIKNLVPDLAGKSILILGVSYLNDVADTRSSPTEILYEACVAEGATVLVHDPMVEHWEEKDMSIDCRMENLANFPRVDVVVFAVRHQQYLTLDAQKIIALFPHAIAIVDANNVLNNDTGRALANKGVAVAGAGKGHWRFLKSTLEKTAK
jgi:nucleotide sugar dehydrogenase